MSVLLALFFFLRIMTMQKHILITEFDYMFKQNLVWSQTLKTHSWATTILLFMLAKNSKYNPVMGAWPAYTQLERPNINYLR